MSLSIDADVSLATGEVTDLLTGLTAAPGGVKTAPCGLRAVDLARMRGNCPERLGRSQSTATDLDPCEGFFAAHRP